MRVLRKKKNAKVLILIASFLFIFIQVAFAAFSLSVSPFEGGFNLDFGKITLGAIPFSKEVTVTVTSDIGKQYRLIQTLLEPLTSLDGAVISPNNLTVSGLRGSNRGGTLNVQDGFPVTLNRQILYTSDQQGQSDTFTLVYNFRATPDIAPGPYRGRISFSLEPVDSTQSPAVAVLNVFAEVKSEATIEIRTSAGSKNLVLNAAREDAALSEVTVSIKGGFGRQFRIIQIVEEEPVSSDGTYLGWESVKFSGAGARKGMVINQPSTLSRQQIIYTSSPAGEPDSFTINYSLADSGNQKAGVYRAGIKYILEGLAGQDSRLLEILGLEIEIPRVFELKVTPEMGGTIRFRDLRPNQPPQIQEVVFEVKSNIAKKYQVTQNTSSLLTTREGKTIGPELFTLRSVSLDTKGTLQFSGKTAIKEGQMVLFASDNEGSPDKFKVVYELEVPGDIHYGDYYTNFTFSVSEI